MLKAGRINQQLILGRQQIKDEAEKELGYL